MPIQKNIFPKGSKIRLPVGGRTNKYAKIQKRADDRRFAERKNAGKCVHHKDREVVSKIHCQECLDKHRDRNNKFKKAGMCPKHTWGVPVVPGRSACQECLDDTAKRGRELRQEAIQFIFESHGVFECHRNIHPNIPDDLKNHECWGKFWIEHPNGGGGKERKKIKNLAAKIGRGKIDPKGYMVLCQLHQLWNQ